MGAHGQTHRLALTLLIVFAAWSTRVPAARADEATPGVLILRNGNVLEGAVQTRGDHYIVASAGAALRVPADQVERACRSLAEAYELRRKERAGVSADAHLDLARWCLRHSLLDEAGCELQDARRWDANHPALASLDLQLRQMVEIRAIRQSGQTTASPPAPAHVLAPPAIGSPRLNPTPDEQSEFIRSVQPMLVHNCATSGCHQPGATQQFQMDRWALEGSGNPTLIRRNLDAVIAQIDKEKPAASPLLQYARQAHGSAAAAMRRPLASHQSMLLLEWVNRVAGVKPPTADEHIAEHVAVETLPAQPVHSIEIESPIIRQTTATSMVRSVETFVPRDAFDPEIFNRNHSARSREVDRAAAEAAERFDHAATEQSAAPSPQPAERPMWAPAASAASSDTSAR
jgi:hypothetical protein